MRRRKNPQNGPASKKVSYGVAARVYLDHTHHDCYLGFVSPKLGNIVLHPGEREFLVKETEVVALDRNIL